MEGWEEIGRLCIRFPHVWHIKRLHAYTYMHVYTHSSMGLAERRLLDSSGMAKAAHPSALYLSNAVTFQCVCVCVLVEHSHIRINKHRQPNTAFPVSTQTQSHNYNLRTLGHTKDAEMRGDDVTHTLSLTIVILSNVGNSSRGLQPKSISG